MDVGSPSVLAAVEEMNLCNYLNFHRESVHCCEWIHDFRLHTNLLLSLCPGKRLFSKKVSGITISLEVELPWRILSIKSRSQTEWMVHIEAKSHRAPPKPHHQPSDPRTNVNNFSTGKWAWKSRRRENLFSTFQLQLCFSNSNDNNVCPVTAQLQSLLVVHIVNIVPGWRYRDNSRSQHETQKQLNGYVWQPKRYKYK